jgi:hypothetical protein
MKMMKKHTYIYLALAGLTLAACSTQDTMSDADKTPIALNASMEGANASVSSRVDTYSAMATGARVYMQVSGTWNSNTVSDKTSATANAASGTTNALTFEAPIYWDDYGTADINNTAGRSAGLTIYAVSAGDGKYGSTPTPSDFTAVSRNLEYDQASKGWSTKDLLISNNVTSTGDGTYKFDSRASGCTLKFKHALSKITVNLYKGDGFTVTEVNSATAAVTLQSLNCVGTVNALTGAVTTTDTPQTIKMLKSTTVVTDATYSTTPYATFTALALPNSTIKQLSSSTFFVVNVNGNVYNVDASKVIAAWNTLKGTSVTEASLESGYNYIFNVIVSKTAINNISATVVNWTDVTGATETPEIVTATAYSDGNTTGTTSGIPATSYLWYTKGKDNLTGYTTTSTMVGTGTATIPATMTYSGSAFTISPLLYWPNHSDIYHLRDMVWSDGTQPAITANASGDYVSLTKGNTAAQDLLYGTHEGTNGVGNGNGAQATKGNIKFTFYHKMSELTVLLTTPATADQVTLAGATVDLLQCATTGTMLVGSGVITPSAVTDVASLPTATAANTFESFVIPQTLTSNLKLRVTITNTDNTKDVYEIALKDIKVSTDGGATYNSITTWNSGVHYNYTLNVKKTGVTVTASLVDWKSATGSTDVIL